METDSPVVYHGTSESRFPASETQRSQLKLTPEELEILRECNKESFYFRCLPLAVAGMTATYLAVKKGFLAPHPRYGASLKMTGAVFIGWFLGKLSYRTTCEDKFLHLENSVVGDAIRKRRGYVLEKHDDEFGSYKSTDDSYKDDESTYFPDSDYHSSASSLNLDVDKKTQYAGLDDQERPSTDKESQVPSAQPRPIKKFTTYEELRRRNREEYERQNKTQHRKSDDTSSQDSQHQWGSYEDVPSKQFNTEYPDGSSKNVYGDLWDNAKFS